MTEDLPNQEIHVVVLSSPLFCVPFWLDIVHGR
jgi:hypothetical protein